MREAQAALKSAQAARDKFYDRIPTVMTMADGAHRDTFLLKRGAYDAPGEKLTPGLPPCSTLPPAPTAFAWRTGLSAAKIRLPRASP